MGKTETFFNVSEWGKCKTGESVNIQRTIYFSSDTAKKFLDPIISQNKEDLEKQKKASEAEEKEVFDKIQKLLKTWEGHASQTLLLTRAIEYLETETVKHTENQWKEAEDGTWEISNLVYKMCFKTSRVAETGEIHLKWSVTYNIPDQPKSHWYNYNRYNNPWGADIYIVKPEKRTYVSLESAQKFIQARFDEYTSFFMELSPPIPYECQKMFSVNGCLLPGYTVAPSEKTELQDIEALLDFLDDADTTSEPPTADTHARKTIPADAPANTSEFDKFPDLPKRKTVRQKGKKTTRKKKKPVPER